MDWTERIKEIKAEKKISTEELSRITEIPLGTLNKALAGQTGSPKLSMLSDIAKAFGISVAYLIGEADKDVLRLTAEYHRLDDIGKSAVMRELENQTRLTTERRQAELMRERKIAHLEPDGIREIVIYDIPVSAGHGSFLDSDHSSSVSIAIDSTTDRADYAVKVSGNSMEPRFFDGDIVIVESCDSVPKGKIGIFLYNGESYIKRYEGDRLTSVNRDYKDMVFAKNDDIRCLGLVLGRLKFTK